LKKEQENSILMQKAVTGMYKVLHELLSDKTGGAVFSCFGIWHLCYLFAAAAAGVLLFVLLKRRDETGRRAVIRRLIHCAFGLYLADFFLMPLAFGEIDIEKLPFHVCTAMCVMCFLSHHWARLEKYRVHVALLGFLSNLVYLIYPAGVMWYQVHPLSYRVVQTLLFHGCMTLYGLFELMFGAGKLAWKTCHKDLAVLIAMTAWARIGNTVYNGQSGSYDHFFNWFFVVRDPFYLLPEHIAPWVMPILNIAVFFAAELLIYAVFAAARRSCTHECL